MFGACASKISETSPKMSGPDFDRGYLVYTSDEVLRFKSGQHRFFALPFGVLGES